MKAIEVTLAILFIMLCIATIEYCPWILVAVILYYIVKTIYKFYKNRRSQFLQLIMVAAFCVSIIIAIAVFMPLVILLVIGLLLYMIYLHSQVETIEICEKGKEPEDETNI